ncbi:deazaflavin-dependent oxidoreductase, nitroreductase family [Pseudonocardia thermophila]|uniref:Deazaflavin-dependent oxidoreductase, nitroreductase family n=1 Tax=Pseudonocardia thermophila TaxID=1848 RepID=A0A1M6R4B4_PSETH|nr:nitroreductase family deazaflavin-dependent oxidoreductase [Pseudonocardia thermophila]SHK27292.1 deazaflavin-dependent oxidoreductase, nitroreductase family [Pseudonocardia thermophila]
MSDWNAQVIAEFRANGGKVGGPFEGAPMIIVHAVGAKTGAVREVPLVYLPEDDGTMVIIASAGGAPKHPAWYHNLKANPRIEVEVGTERFAVTAEEIRDEERDLLWERIVAWRPGFGEYQEKTDRIIPLFRLT